MSLLELLLPPLWRGLGASSIAFGPRVKGVIVSHWPSITEWEVHITAQGPRLRNDLYCVEWDVKL